MKKVLKNGISNIYSWQISLIQMFFVYAWISILPKTDSFFSVYSLFAVAGLCCLMYNWQRKSVCSGKIFCGALAFSVAFSMSVILGNYMLFEPVTALMSLLNIGLCFVGGIVIAQNILIYALTLLPIERETQVRTGEKKVFFLSFFCVIVVDLVYLFFASYPAIVDVDAVAELEQAMGYSPYSTWTPYWHTRTLEAILDPAYALLGDANAALACVTVVQVIFIAMCFAYALVTLYQMGLPKLLLSVVFFVYVLYPYNIVFNVTLGKDIAFGVAMLLVITALLRIITGTGKKQWLNYLMFIIGSFGFCMWRTNGMYIYLIIFPVLLFKFKLQKKLLLTVMLCVSMICAFLNGPYLDQKDYQEIPFTETLAVPFQQIGRLIVNDRELAEADTVFLSEIFYLDQVKELYRPESVDPMKFDALRHGNLCFLEENFGEFLEMWIRLGFEYPGDYLRAWIDETRGYWNGGYHMGVYDQGIADNEVGFYVSSGNNAIAGLFAAYIRYVEDPVILAPLKSIGFVVWVVLACWWLNVLKKRQVSLLAVPVLVLLAGLWTGTPVFAEFRYGYPVFLVSPVIILTTLFDLESLQRGVSGKG